MVLIVLYKMILTFESVDESLQCDYSNKSSAAVLPNGYVYFSAF